MSPPHLTNNCWPHSQNRKKKNRRNDGGNRQSVTTGWMTNVNLIEVDTCRHACKMDSSNRSRAVSRVHPPSYPTSSGGHLSVPVRIHRPSICRGWPFGSNAFDFNICACTTAHLHPTAPTFHKRQWCQLTRQLIGFTAPGRFGPKNQTFKTNLIV